MQMTHRRLSLSSVVLQERLLLLLLLLLVVVAEAVVQGVVFLELPMYVCMYVTMQGLRKTSMYGC